ncbi:MAG: tRNA (5-methylaminomethyl-2-thiouridine)(34)-methyltransferase MnmD [Bacteroidales bacterium]|nr:tRNA (5-methylaminomethyl-2-thiouridine)(34)-methyltransferase MnmD [Bacteroidales bacterium]MDD4386045.1 tRNA (5-methylaminomethyl-2-thiouridine)(34)-methyltransferase MnmD [Bacteroidales bacterium]
MIQNQLSHINTDDGTSTLYSSKYKAHYHSLYGSFTESKHIFIDAGLAHVGGEEISILEVGLGTGLNAALTAQWAIANSKKINYHAIELYPLGPEHIKQLNFSQSLKGNASALWEQICYANWETEQQIDEHFCLLKQSIDFTQWQPNRMYNLVYFDAFAPDDQPEMWTVEEFKKIYNALLPQSVLVTYSVKGIVKRALSEVGFTIKRLEGPTGKKHILRATKSN